MTVALLHRSAMHPAYTVPTSAASVAPPPVCIARNVESRTVLSRISHGPLSHQVSSQGACFEGRGRNSHWRVCAQNGQQEDNWTNWTMPDDVPQLTEFYNNGAAVLNSNKDTENEEASLAQVLRADTVRLWPPHIWCYADQMRNRTCVGCSSTLLLILDHGYQDRNPIRVACLNQTLHPSRSEIEIVIIVIKNYG